MNNFDKKNQIDFKKNTENLTLAIDKIRKNASTPATIAELSRLTGMHRNAISRRKWPTIKLKEIKAERKKKQILNTSEHFVPNPVSVMEENLKNAKKELSFWFNKHLDSEKKIKQLELNLQRMTQAREEYDSMLKKERQKTLELTKQLNIMRELIS